MRFVASDFRCVFLLCALLTLASPSHAQSASDTSGLTAGTFLLRGRAVGIFPNKGGPITAIGGYIAVSNSATPEVDLSYFVTDHIAIEGEGGITRNTLTAKDTVLGRVDVGSVWGAPVLALLQYHLLPLARWNPYAGVGVAVLPYFDAQPAGGRVQELSVRSEVGAVFQAGIDLRITDRWFGNLDIKKLLVKAYASVDDGAFTSSGHLNPLLVGLGIGYRF